MESTAPAKKILPRSCARCKRRKIRCNGAVPQCSSCVGNEDECVYPTEVRRRGPGKKKLRVEALEQRLMEMESELNQLKSSTNQSGIEPTQSSNRRSAHSSNVPIHSVGEEAPSHNYGSVVMLSTAFLKLLSDRIHNFDVVKKNPGSLHFGTPSVVVPEEPERHLAHLCAEDISREIPFLRVERFIERLNQPGSLRDTKDISWWALLNSAIALMTRLKILNECLEKFSLPVWAYFKNSYSVYSRLLVANYDEWTIQASLAMTLFLHGSADVHTTAMLLSAAIHQLQVHVFRGQGDLFNTRDKANRDSLSRIFWAAFILDSDQSLNTGLSPTLIEEELDVNLAVPSPSLPTGDETKYEWALKARTELALIQGRIRTQLHGPRSVAKSTSEMLFSINELQSSLDAWTLQISADVCPKSEKIQSSSDVPLLMLRLAYYNCVSFINWFGVTELHELGAAAAAMAKRVRVSARATIEMSRFWDALPFADLWRILRYQIAAAITLLVCILQDATHADVTLDLATLECLAANVARLVEKEKCDLHEVLFGCRQIFNLAMATFEDQPSAKDAEAAELAKYINHPMRVAQRWMGNLQTRSDPAAQKLASLLGFSANSDEGYGPLVPRSMRPETYEPETDPTAAPP